MKPPKQADIVVGELQSFAVSPSYGGPFAGIIASKEKYIRQLPGRLVGETLDADGHRAFCLTLATREQHIRREKATSNICTNQALLALMATVFMTVYGKRGLRELAEQNLAKAHYLASRLDLPFEAPFFNEFVARAKGTTPERINAAVAGAQDHRRPAAGAVLPGTEGLDAALCDGNEQARGHGRCSNGVRRRQMIKKVSKHIVQNEPLLFELSSPGKIGYQLPELDVPEVDAEQALGGHVRAEIEGFPEVSEIEALRHFTRLSTWNYAIDLGLYPLGSCTMKYNPRINELVARIDGLAWAHPYQPDELSQGCMEVIAALERALAEITGLDAVTLQPAAGAHGEFTGVLMIRALLESRGNPRKTILVPDSAHGTNPATAMMVGYNVKNIKSNDRGVVDVAALEQHVTDDIAGLMLTNPNTVGVFEEDIKKICSILHEKGAMVYMDGANMNALVGVTRPGDLGIDVMHLNLHKTFSTPHGGGGPGSGAVAVASVLTPFLPGPRLQCRGDKWAWNYDLPQSIGRVRAFYGNFGVLVRALAYIMAHGGKGLRQATLDASVECELHSLAVGALLRPGI